MKEMSNINSLYQGIGVFLCASAGGVVGFVCGGPLLVLPAGVVGYVAGRLFGKGVSNNSG